MVHQAHPDAVRQDPPAGAVEALQAPGAQQAPVDVDTSVPAVDLTLCRPDHPAFHQAWDGHRQQNSEASADIGLSERFRAAGLIARTVNHVRQFQSESKAINDTLRQGQDGELGGLVKLSDFWSSFRGEFGGVFYDLTGSEFGRGTAQRLSAISLTIASAIDDLIDEADLPAEQQVELIERTQGAITTGVYSRSDYPIVNCITSLAHDLHAGISVAPAPELFNQCYIDLADAAIEQISGDSADAHSVTRRVGGGTIAVSMGVLYAFNPELDRRFLDSAMHFGAHWQYLDDRDDVVHDKEQGIVTALTVAENIEAAQEDATLRSDEHLRSALDCLRPEERVYLRTIENVLQFGLRVKNLLKGHREFPGRPGG